jgi:formylglycine-generating enzyme required for sulfatase activity
LYVRCTDSTGKHFQKAITVEAKAYAPPEFNEADFVRFEGGLVTGSLDPQSRIFVTDRVLDIPPFMLARYEVTQALWWDVYQWAIKGGDYADRAGETYSFTVQEAANNDNPALPDAAPSEPDAGKPQTGIIWNNVILWLNALTEMRGLGADAAVYRSSNAPARSGSGVPDYERSGFRLPSEAEWEYAARGGVYSLEPGSPWMDNTVGRTGGPADYKKYAHYGSGISSLTLVGLYRPNTAGLYDMGCNASEWCGDMYKIYFLESITAENTDVWGPTGSNTGTYRVTRGKDYSSTLPPVFGGGAGGNTNDAGSGSNQAAYFYSKPIAGKTGFRIARAAGTGD